MNQIPGCFWEFGELPADFLDFVSYKRSILNRQNVTEDRLNDALNATRAAVEEGIVRGSPVIRI